MGCFVDYDEIHSRTPALDQFPPRPYPNTCCQKDICLIPVKLLELPLANLEILAPALQEFESPE